MRNRNDLKAVRRRMTWKAPVGRMLVDSKIRSRWRNYLFQRRLGACVLTGALFVFDAALQSAYVVVAALTAGIVFVMPHSGASKPRRVIGGHVAAALIGSLFLLLLLLTPAVNEFVAGSRPIHDLAAALSVGLSIFFMASTNTEHPPAAGTALGLSIGGWSISALAFVLTAAALLSATHGLLRRRMVNLI